MTNDDRVLILMRGIPGSGKSTRSFELYQEIASQGVRVARLSTDDLFLDEHGVFRFDPSLLEEHHAKNWHDARNAMANGVPYIIIDNCNLIEDHYGPYIFAASRFSYQVVFEEPTSPHWLNFKRRVDQANEYTKELMARKFARLNQHGAPVQTILSMIDAWTGAASGGAEKAGVDIEQPCGI